MLQDFRNMYCMLHLANSKSSINSSSGPHFTNKLSQRIETVIKYWNAIPSSLVMGKNSFKLIATDCLFFGTWSFCSDVSWRSTMRGYTELIQVKPSNDVQKWS